MKHTLLFLFLSLGNWLTSQVNWSLQQTLKADSNAVWNSDILGNIYLTQGDLLQKIDSNGVVKFSQSQKSTGTISSIQPINTMKLVLFSEEQQTFCMLDNTLSKIENCTELANFQIDYASAFSISAQPDKFWVYDQLNSKIHLLSLGKTSQSQEIQNLKGILNSIQFSYISEQNYQLYIVDALKGIYVLDMYGTLLDFYQETDVIRVCADEKFIYVLKKTGMKMIEKETRKTLEIALPEEGITDFKKNGNFFYLKSKSTLKKYKLFFP